MLSVAHAKLGMSSADGDVVEENVAARKSPGSCDRLIQQKVGSGIAPAYNDKQRRAAGQPLSPPLGLGRAGRTFKLVVQVERKGRGVMHAAVIGVLVGV